MTWAIAKQQKTGACRACGKGIAVGSHAFGNQRERYHLTCAGTAKPRVFAPFETRADKLIAAQPRTLAPAPRNPELEARVAANPADEATLAVYADYLQSHGDPWGELIAFELAGQPAEAKRVFAEHAAAFMGGQPRSWFTWKGAFIEEVIMALRMSIKKARASVRTVLELPAMLLARELRVPLLVDAEIIAMVNELAPPRMTTFFCWLGDAVSELAVPSIERLHLLLVREPVLDVRAFAPMFALERMPKLRRLDLYDAPISVGFLEALLDSPLGRQLDWLELTQKALDDAGTRFLLDRADQVRRIRRLSLDPPDALAAPVRDAFGDQLAAHSAAGRD
ncbi:MAG: TIGR02996 domain-containing protein [Kofleriaceae bacterium]